MVFDAFDLAIEEHGPLGDLIFVVEAIDQEARLTDGERYQHSHSSTYERESLSARDTDYLLSAERKVDLSGAARQLAQSTINAALEATGHTAIVNRISGEVYPSPPFEDPAEALVVVNGVLNTLDEYRHTNFMPDFTEQIPAVSSPLQERPD